MRSPEELHDLFARSEFGATLNSSIRFADFKPVDIEDSLWVELLGDDVNNLQHMPHTYRLAQRFSEAEQLSERRTDTLLVTAITHDWGEAVIGDIAFPSKTARDEVDEEVAYRSIAEELLGKYEGEELADIVWDTLAHKRAVTGDMFTAIEHLGYNTTAMRAGYMGRAIASRLVNVNLDRATTEHLAGGLIGFEATMQSMSYASFSGYANKYPAIQTIIKEGVPYRIRSEGGSL